MTYAVLGALVVGLSLGIFGSGGSILAVPILVYVLGHDDKTAIAESLAIVGGIALVGAARHGAAKLVAWRLVFLFGVPAMGGTYLGSLGAKLVRGDAQLLVFAVVMAAAAVMMWRRTRPKPVEASPDHATQPPQPRQPLALIIPQGVAVGALTGFVGVGGGFLIVPALVLLAGLPMRRAVGTSLAIIVLNCAVGFWKHHADLASHGGSVDWPTIVAFIVVGALGTLAGKSVSSKINQRALQRGFAVFLILMAALIIASKAPSVLGTPTTDSEGQASRDEG